MGIYTSNRYFGREVPDYASQIPANEAYDAAFGCAHILADCQANDMALFESSIYSDMQEVMSIQEGYQVVNENAFTDVLKKIAEMFKKLIAKIKGIFKAFIAKLGGFAKDGKELVKKYEKQILKCANWKQFKLKGIRKPKGGSTDIKSQITELFKTSSGFNISGNRYKLTKADLSSYTANELGDALSSAEKIKKADSDDIKEALLKLYVVDAKIKISDYKDFSTDVTEALYDEEDSLDGDDDNIDAQTFTATWIKGVLQDTKWLDESEKMTKKLEQCINQIIDDINKSHDDLTKIISKDNGGTVTISANHDFGHSGVTKDYHKSKKNVTWAEGKKSNRITKDQYDKLSSEKQSEYEKVDATDETKGYKLTTGDIETGDTKATDVQPILHAMQKIASNEQEVVSKVTSEYMAQVKFAIAQAKKMWTSAAAYSSTEHKEDYSYYNALGDAYAEQVYMNFEAIRG